MSDQDMEPHQRATRPSYMTGHSSERPGDFPRTEAPGDESDESPVPDPTEDQGDAEDVPEAD